MRQDSPKGEPKITILSLDLQFTLEIHLEIDLYLYRVFLVFPRNNSSHVSVSNLFHFKPHFVLTGLGALSCSRRLGFHHLNTKRLFWIVDFFFTKVCIVSPKSGGAL